MQSTTTVSHPDTKAPSRRLHHRATLATGLLALVLGLTVILGWHSENPLLIQLLPNMVPMQYNTALGLALCGVALLGLALSKTFFAAIAGWIAASLGAVTLIQYLSGINVGLDQFFMEHYITVATSHPGRMAPNTALCLLLSGVGCVLLASKLEAYWREVIAQFLGLCVLALAAMALVGYLVGVENAYGWGALTKMALHTAVGLFAIAIGVIACAVGQPQRQVAEVPLWVPGALFGLVLTADVYTSLDIAAGIAYVPLTFCCLWFTRNYAPVICALFATLLITLGHFASAPGSVSGDEAALNRLLSVLAVWVSAIILLLYWRTAQKLKANSARLEMVLEGSAIGFWDWDVPAGRVDYSQHWFAMLGYTPAELKPDLSTWEDLLHPDDKPNAVRTVTQYLQGELREYNIAFRMRHKMGDWLWIRARGKIFERDADNNPLRVIGTHIDITDSKQAAERLILLQNAIDHSNSMVIITSAETKDPKILYASAGCEQILGLSANYLLNHNPALESLLEPDDRQQTNLAQIFSKLRQGIAANHEFQITPKGRNSIQLQLYSFPVKNITGDINYLGHIGYDITAQRTVELELSKEQKQFRSVVEFSPIGIALVSPEGRWLNVNQALCDIIGYSREELLQSDFQTITHPEDLDLDLAQLHQTLVGEIKGYEMEKRYYHKNGDIVWILLSVSLVWNDDGTPSHFISQIQDITKRKHDEERARHYMAELERSNRDLDDFAYIASHDLKEPLRAINNHSQYLLKNYSNKIDDKGQHKLERLSKLTNRMEQLISDLLFFSRLGRSEFSKEFVDCNKIAAEQIDTLTSFLADRQGEVIINDSLPSLTYNRSHLSTIFYNLITNGIKYNENETKHVEISFDTHYAHTGRQLRNVFHISDNGIGIEPDFFDAIFRMFKRLNNEKTYGEGTGAGLTFVKKIIERNGGQIWLDSEISRGTTFHFTLEESQHEEA